MNYSGAIVQTPLPCVMVEVKGFSLVLPADPHFTYTKCETHRRHARS